MEDRSPSPSPIAVPDVWENVPQRNRNFTGRGDLLTELRHRASTSTTAVLPQALHGLGGVGKTQLAIEYAYRYASHYQLVVWIPADQIALVRSALAGLAPRLGITEIPQARVEDAMAAVLDALRRGKPFARWLLIFDNADQPELIREFIPHGPGDVIVTSRNRGWTRLVDALEVDVFTREESLEYLRRRVPGVTTADASQLAEELGDLPLALEQAAALLAETVMTVPVYLDLLNRESDRVLGENPPPSDYPLPVAAAWSLSVTRLREQTPYAMELLQRCAFFGPAPISLELLDRGRYVLTSPLRDTLRDPILMSRAIRALGRYSLVRIDNYRRSLEVHRIIQRLIRNELDTESRYEMRHEVHQLLAAANPGNPDYTANWPKYDELLGHVGPAEIVTCRTPEVRHLAQHIVRYLLVTCNYASALTSADRALEHWTADSGPDDPYVLIMSRLKAQILRATGRYREAYELYGRTFEKMRTVLGPDHEETLILMNGRCIDLRARGDFAASLALTKDLVEQHRAALGEDHPRTLAAMNNLAEDYELNSDYAAARVLNEELYEEKRVVYLGDSHPNVLLTLNALARIMREEGHFALAQETSRRAYEGFQELIRQHVIPDGHPWALLQQVDYSAVLRAAGDDPEALRLAQDAYDRYQRAFGARHAASLAAANNLANALRLGGDSQGAAELLATTEKQCIALFDEHHLYTLLTGINLSITKRRQGEPEAARQRLAEILDLLRSTLGPRSHPALMCAVNLANALADLGKPAAAIEIGEEVLPELTAILGADHPHTLTCATNLALDLKTTGNADRAAKLTDDAIARYRSTLGMKHPEVMAAESGQRQDLGIEVPVLF